MPPPPAWLAATWRPGLRGQPELASLAKAQAARIVDGALRWRFAWDAEAPDIVAR